MEFHHVSPAGQPEFKRSQHQTSGNADVVSNLHIHVRVVHLLMKKAPFRRVGVVGPYGLNVHKRGPALAERQVLQG